LHQAGEECAGGDRLAKGDEEVNRTGGDGKGRRASRKDAEFAKKSREEKNESGPPRKDGPYNGKKYKDGAI
jgi:hypothetical protein